MQNEMSLDGYGVVEMEKKDSVDINAGSPVVPPWLWQAAVGTFVYNCLADWKENLAAFNSGRQAAK